MAIQEKDVEILSKLELQKEEFCPVCMYNICTCSEPSYKQYVNCLAVFRRKAKSKSWLMDLIR